MTGNSEQHAESRLQGRRSRIAVEVEVQTERVIIVADAEIRLDRKVVIRCGG